MKQIYTARHGWDAQMVRDILVLHDIQAAVHGPPLGFESGPQHVVIFRDEDEQRAAELIRDFDANAGENARDPGFVWMWRCQRCGEAVEQQFTVCWNCESPRDADESGDGSG